jgi:acyl-CoA reductase-like NAD-dependent aldehyde dehydrogenase
MTATQFTTPYINGHAIEVADSELAPVVNPANGQTIAKVFMARPHDMKKAIEAAYAAKDA